MSAAGGITFYIEGAEHLIVGSGGFDSETGPLGYTAQMGLPQSSFGNVLMGGVVRTASKQLTLFTKAPLVAGRNFDGSTTLFVWGKQAATPNSIPLFLTEITKQAKGMALFVLPFEPPPFIKTVKLAVTGSTNKGAVGAAPLVTSGTDLIRTMPLFTCGPKQDQTVRNMNLWTGGVYARVTGSTTLFLQTWPTEAQGQNYADPLLLENGTDPFLLEDVRYFFALEKPPVLVAPLFISGTTSPAPFKTHLNLYLKRPFEAGMPLTIKTAGNPVSGAVSLFTVNAFASNNNTPLVMPVVIGKASSNPQLYTSGW